MATNDTTSSDEATLVPTQQGNGQDRERSTGQDAGQHDGAPQGDAAAATDAPAPRRRASRRTTKKATTISPTASAEPAPSGDDAAPAAAPEPGTGPSAQASTEETREGTSAGTAASTSDTAETAEIAETKRPARKRAARKKAEPGDASAEAPKTTRRGSRTKADRASAAVEELVTGALSGEVETTTVTLQNAPPVADAADLPTLVDLDALAETAETEETEAADETEAAGGNASGGRQTSVVPSFSVLFQAPDASQAVPTRRRRGAPQPVVEEPVDEPSDDRDDHESRTREQDDSDVADQPDDRSDDLADEESSPRRSRRRRGGKGRRGRGSDDDDTQDQQSDSDDSQVSGRADDVSVEPADDSDAGHDSEHDAEHDAESDSDDEGGTSRRRRRRRRAGSAADNGDDTPNVSTRVRQPRTQSDEPVAVKGSTRLEAKKQRRREGREAGRRRTVITEAEFLARREAVDRVMVVRNKDGRTQMGVLEDGVLVEHYIDQATNVSMAGNIYLGRVQNVLPSMEAAFVDIGKGRNAVLYAGEVNWDAAGLEANQPKRIEHALGSGQTVLVQVTKDPIGHKGARLTSQISLPGRYLVYVPNSSMTGISRKLPDTERARLKKILRDVVPDTAGVIVRTAAEGASEEELRADVERLTRTWEEIQAKAEGASSPRAGKSKGKKKNGAAGSVTGGQAPMLLHGEPDLTVRVIRDVFNEDFKQLVVSGEQAWNEIHPYISSVAPDLADRVTKWTSNEDLFTHHRVDEQLSKAMDRKVWLPSGGSLVIDRTEAMTVVDVNTGKFIGSGGNLEETVTKNNIEAAEEIVRQLRLRDIGGIIVIDFIDMVLESNRELVVRRLLECLGRDRTKHQVAEVTSLGLVQMTRKRVGSGLIEVFSETCDHCNGRGFVIHTDPVDKGAHPHESAPAEASGSSRRRGRGQNGGQNGNSHGNAGQESGQQSAAADARSNGPTAAQIAAAAHAAALKSASGQPAGDDDTPVAAEDVRPEPSFPHDEGQWSGDGAFQAEPADDQPTRGGAHVGLESDVSDPQQGSQPSAEAAHQLTPAPEPAPAAQPATRGRRRRGRVVAPAGPPRPTSGGDSAPPAGAEG